MARDLSKQELQAALDKLRTQYTRYAEQYDRQVFNLDRFNERWLESIRIGMPAGHFLAGEVETFRELVKKAEEKYAPPDRTISDKVDRMLEDFAVRIDRYPAHALCPRADEETCRLAGALLFFQEHFGDLLLSPRRFAPGSKGARLAAALGERGYALLVPRAGGLPRLMDELVLSLSRLVSGEREQAAAKKEFFKEAGFLLNLAADLFSFLAGEGAGSLSGDFCPAPERVAEARVWVETALDDFRIREFRLREW